MEGVELQQREAHSSIIQVEVSDIHWGWGLGGGGSSDRGGGGSRAFRYLNFEPAGLNISSVGCDREESQSPQR